MTNIIILSSVLVTNWGMMTLQNPREDGLCWRDTVQEGFVTRVTNLGMKTGTNTVFIGNFECVAGIVYKTNNVCGPMMPWKEEK